MAFLALVAFALAVCADGRYVPPTHREGDRVVMPLVFPDGTRVEATYPPELRLAELGVVPYGSATLEGESPHPARDDTVGRDFVIRYGDYARLRSHPLRFAFGDWRVEVWDLPPGNPGAMTAEERRAFRDSLSGHVTADGFLVLDARPPLTLATYGEHAGPSLEFGSPGLPPWITLQRLPCRPMADWWCLSDGIMARAEGDRRFLAAVTEGLELR